MIPSNTIRQAIYTALSGNVTLPVYTAIPEDVSDYVLLDAVRLSEDSAQTNFVYDCYVDIEVVKTYQKTGNKSEAAAIALAIDNILRPSVTGFVSISGWSVAGIRLDSTDELADLINEKKVMRVLQTYYMKIFKT